MSAAKPVVLDLDDPYFDGQTLSDALRDYDHVHSTTGVCVKSVSGHFCASRDPLLCPGDGCPGCYHCASTDPTQPSDKETPMDDGTHGTYQQNPDGSWTPAEPLPYYGWKAKTEQRLRRRGFNRLANFLAWWDERGLG